MSIIDQIFQAGVVGCGGAGFPTHVKYKGQIEQLIINGAECEPLLRTDRYLMRTYAHEIVETVAVLKSELGIEKCTIGLKEAYSDEIKALRGAIEETDAPVELHLMPSFYPAGDEQTLVYEVTGRVVPPAGIPMDVGCVVSNIATVLAISDARKEIPFTHKFLTVSGEVNSPTILRVPLGTPVTECIRLAGGARLSDYAVLLGGPMMGKVITREEAEERTVIKTMSGIVLLPKEHIVVSYAQAPVERMVSRARAACIRCSQCTDLCPRHLLGHPIEPHRVMRRLALEGDLNAIPSDDPVLKNALLCCECGVCELIACPMGLQPRRINAEIKKRLGAEKIRYPKGEGQTDVHLFRDERRAATARAVARSGVQEYQSYQIDSFQEADPEKVCLPLSQHIGAPCEPVVSSGDVVTAGQLIARCPENKLGTNLHASISGRVTVDDKSITITR
ncbi:MAG: 4Fe-4S dicluster domain-containing protein [Oscillospiraceae bacterium]|jgi:Na+-translocating ferredoxin:NAD+ oxidoreductase RnfC subunit